MTTWADVGEKEPPVSSAPPQATGRARWARYTVNAVGIIAVGLVAGCHWELWPCHHATFVSLRVQPDSIAITVGQQVTLQAVGQYQGTTSAGDACTVDGGPGGSLTWVTSDSIVARVTYTRSDIANVQGVDPGRAAISVTNSSGTQARSVVVVTAPSQ